MRPVFYFPTVTILECAPRRVMVATWQRAAGGGWRCLRSRVQALAGEVATEAAWLAATVVAIPALGAPAGPVVLVLPAERTLTTMFALPPVASAAREKIIRFELGQTVPVPRAVAAI